jgi:hypothetical protein
MVGAVAGSPGTFPTNWNQSGGLGLTSTISLGTENGLQYLDIRYSGTATLSFVEFRLETPNGISASNGQTWTFSPYIKAISGTIPTSQLVMIERNSLSAFITQGGAGFSATSSLQRFSFTRTLAGGATVAFVQPLILFTLTIGAAYDFTIRIAAPQMELGAYATTFIPTTTAAVTRLADASFKTGVSNLINSPQGSLYIDSRSLVNGGSFRLFSISDGTANNRITIGWSSVSSTLLAFMILGGTIVVNNNISAFDQTANSKILFRWGGGNFNVFINGVNRLSLTSVTMPTANLFNRIGFDLGTSSSFFEGNVAQAALFTAPLTDEECITITTL